MGQCCTICLTQNICCNIWCGCCKTCCCGNSFGKSNLDFPLRNRDEFIKDMESNEFNTGDLFLQHSSGSSHSMILSNSRWTHVGMIYKRDNINTKTCDNEYNNNDEHKNDNILIIEEVYETPNSEFTVKKPQKLILNSIKKIFDAKIYGKMPNEYPHYYAGIRKRKVPLTDEQKRKLDTCIDDIINTPYGGMDKTDSSAFYACLDCGCHCIKSNTTKKSIEKMFCSEAIAYISQNIDVMRKDFSADDIMPADFEERKLWMYSVNYEDQYKPCIYYGIPNEN